MLAESLVPMVLSVALFAAISIPVYERIRSRHRERMALIEKGIVSEDVKYLYGSGRNNPFSSLKWGLIFVFVGIAIMLSMLAYLQLDVTEAIYFALISIGAGTALLLFYRIASRKQREGDFV